MAMNKQPLAATPEIYVNSLAGWQLAVVEHLRAAVRAGGALDERIRWGHLVCFDHGPMLLIRAEESRVLFGFFRGKRLTGIDERLKPGGKYELATMVLREGDTVSVARARKLVAAAIKLNRELGDPTKQKVPIDRVSRAAPVRA